MLERRHVLHIDPVLTEKFFAPITPLKFEFQPGEIPLPSNNPQKLQEFFASADGITFKKQFKELVIQLLNYAKAHHIPDAENACTVFTKLFIEYQANDLHMNEVNLPLYTNGVPTLYAIIKYIKSVNNDPSECKDILRNLMQEIRVCGPGVYINLAAAYMQLVAKHDMSHYMKACREKLIRQYVAEMLPNNLGALETHYITAICNRYADALNIDTLEDSHIAQCKSDILDPYMRLFEEGIKKHLSTEIIIDYIITNRGIQTILDELIQAKPDEYPPIIDKLNQALKLTGNGKLNVYDLLLQDENTGKFIGRLSACADLLFLHVLQGLIADGYIDASRYTKKETHTNDVVHTLPNHDLSSGYVETHCDLILLPTFDAHTYAEKNMALLSQVRTAYIVTGDNKLFYVDQLNKTCDLIAGINEARFVKKQEKMDDKAKANANAERINTATRKMQISELAKKLGKIKQALSPTGIMASEEDNDNGSTFTELLTFLQNAATTRLTNEQKDDIDHITELSQIVPNKQPLIIYLVQLYLYHHDQYQRVMSDFQWQRHEHEVAEGVALFLTHDAPVKILKVLETRSLNEIMSFATKNRKEHLTEARIKLSFILRFSPDEYATLASTLESIVTLTADLHSTISSKEFVPYYHKLFEFYLHNIARSGNITTVKDMRNFLKYYPDNTIETLQKLFMRPDITPEVIAKLFGDFKKYFDILEKLLDPETHAGIILYHLKLYDINSIEIILRNGLSITDLHHLNNVLPDKFDDSILAKLTAYEILVRCENNSINTLADIINFITIDSDNMHKNFLICQTLKSSNNNALNKIIAQSNINDLSDLIAFCKTHEKDIELALYLLPIDSIKSLIKSNDALLELLVNINENNRVRVLFGILHALDANYIDKHILISPNALLNYFSVTPKANHSELVVAFTGLPSIRPAIARLNANYLSAILSIMNNDHDRLAFLKSIKNELKSIITSKKILFDVLDTFTNPPMYLRDIFRLCHTYMANILDSSNPVIKTNVEITLALLLDYFSSISEHDRKVFIENCSDLGACKFPIENLAQLQALFRLMPHAQPGNVMKIFNFDAINQQQLHEIFSGSRNTSDQYKKLIAFMRDTTNPEMYKYLMIGLLKDYIKPKQAKFERKQQNTRFLKGFRCQKSTNHQTAEALLTALLNNLPPELLLSKYTNALNKGKTNLSNLYSLYKYLVTHKNTLLKSNEIVYENHPSETLKIVIAGHDDLDLSNYINQLNVNKYTFNNYININCNLVCYKPKNNSDSTLRPEHPFCNIDAGIILFDTTNEKSFNTAKELYLKLEQECRKYRTTPSPIILVGMNTDATNRLVANETIANFTSLYKLPYVPLATNDISANEHSFTSLVKQAIIHTYPQYDYFRPDLGAQHDLGFLAHFCPEPTQSSTAGSPVTNRRQR